MPIQQFRQLDAWQQAHELVLRTTTVDCREDSQWHKSS
jgi:hypothetical protein